ncbi:uncharacterized protein LOC131891780 [Tigriopus californicus]|uniref:uncharacterized protein LOC131891780 n=1 Tax=Tigriopus californicus TaxID=6832 RepID=UPI0027DA6443|nr:uncharacterized protein LOC131891780 [Tigriopus californicus]
MSVSGGKKVIIRGQRKVIIRLQSLDGTYTSPAFEACTSPKVTADLQPVASTVQQFEHLQGIQFAEGALPTTVTPVTLLVGEPMFTHLQQGTPIRKGLHDPAAVFTKLGTILAGAVSSIGTQPEVFSFSLVPVHEEKDSIEQL